MSRDYESGEVKPKSYERTIAIWTIVLGVATLALFVATTVNVWIINRTDQSVASQARTADDQERRQLRAYVGPVFMSFKSSCSGCDPSAQIPFNDTSEIIFDLKNYGTTPALTPYFCSELILAPTGDKLGELTRQKLKECIERPQKHRLISPTMWPTESRTTKAQIFDKEKFAEIASAPSSSVLLLVFRVEYNDVFNKPHRTYGCRILRLQPISAGGANFIGCNLNQIDFQDD